MKRLVRDCPSVDNTLHSRKEVLLQFWGLGGRLNLLTIHKILGKCDEMFYRTSERSGFCERGCELFGFSKWQGKGVSGLQQTYTFVQLGWSLMTDLMNSYGGVCGMSLLGRIHV